MSPVKAPEYAGAPRHDAEPRSAYLQQIPPRPFAAGADGAATNGRSIFNPHAVRVRKYPVAVEGSRHQHGPAAERVETYRVDVESRMVVLRV